MPYVSRTWPERENAITVRVLDELSAELEYRLRGLRAARQMFAEGSRGMSDEDVMAAARFITWAGPLHAE